MRISSIIFYHHLFKTGTEVVLTVWKITRICFNSNQIITPKTRVYFIKIKFPSEFLGKKRMLLFVPSWLSNSHSFSVHGPCLYSAYLLFCFLGLKWATHVKPLVGNPASLQRKCTKWENMPDLQTGWLPKKHLSPFLLMFIEKKGHMDGQND